MSNLAQDQWVFAQNVSALIIYIFGQGYKCTFGEAYRTEAQAKIYAAEGKGIVNSLHRQRLAIDLNVFNSSGIYLMTSELYKPFGEFWEGLHARNRWGGNFIKKPDGNHFEMTL